MIQEIDYRVKGIKFCSTCSNMLNPIEEDNTLKFVCRFCEYKEQVRENPAQDDHLIYRREIKDKQSQDQTFDPEFALDYTMPRERNVNCPKCHYNEAVYFMTADAEDTMLRKVFICGRVEDGNPKCGNYWFSDEVKKH